MIPDSDERGCLPPGIHMASLEEIAARFGRATFERQEQMQSIVWLMEMIRRDDVLRVLLNGSFVTSKPEPGDVDCVILGGPTFGRHSISLEEWREPLPYIHLDLVDPAQFARYVNDIFGRDAALRPKGIIEVRL